MNAPAGRKRHQPASPEASTPHPERGGGKRAQLPARVGRYDGGAAMTRITVALIIAALVTPASRKAPCPCPRTARRNAQAAIAKAAATARR